MKVSCYSTAWSVISKKFDVAGALDNWATFADEIVIAVPTCDTDDSATIIQSYAKQKGYNVVIVRPDSDFENDPFAYGKTENAALQACTGTLLCQANLDERWRVQRDRLEQLHIMLENRWDVRAFWVPTIDLYGDEHHYLPPLKTKWYLHGQSLFRAPARFGIKPDGRPDYNKTSSDELVTITGDIAPAAHLITDLSTESIRTYVSEGWPIVYHLGYLNLADRLDRSIWWHEFWKRATAGDPNKHPTSIEEMAAKETKEHGLPLWSSVES